MMDNRILHINDLYKTFEDKSVIEGVSLSLHDDENLVVLGKSGSGKSVIMKCIVGLMDPDSGSISVFGTDVLNCNERDLNQIRTRIGYLFQEGAMYDSMSVRENLIFPLRRNEDFRKMSEKEVNELVEHNLESVGLLDAIDKWPAELSGGMKKRAGLARSLMLSPEMIIYDEPTTGLDPYTSEAISELILKIKEQYKTSSIIITHDIKCAKKTGDRLLILHEGRFIAEGSFAELAQNPADEIKLFFN